MKRFLLSAVVLVFVLSLSGIAAATNGDNLMGIGPISRSMGGVGIANPLDAISAVFANPAAMCFGPYCPGTEVDFAGTLFMPHVKASVTAPGLSVSDDSHKKVFAIPAIGLSVPINPDWRFGLSAYGVSGLGVDYRDTAIERNFPSPPFPAGIPIVAGSFTQLQIMKFSPAIAYRASDNLSLGLGVHIDYASLDLGAGNSFSYGLGGQLGVIYKPVDGVSIGLTYVSEQEVNYRNVRDFDNDGRADNLKLAQPQQAGIGISFEPIKNTVMIEVDGKWVNWADAKGYDTFDWRDQWVLAVGAQYKPTKELALRVGYNYGNNPVREHNNFVGFNGTPVPPMTSIQGKNIPTYFYETFRIIGFPAIVKQHASVGLGYEISSRFAVNAGYTHAFKEKISENGTNIFGQPTTLSSTLSEDSLEFGVTWRF